MKKLNEVAKKYAVASQMTNNPKGSGKGIEDLEKALTNKKRSKKLEMEDEEGLEIEIEKE